MSSPETPTPADASAPVAPALASCSSSHRRMVVVAAAGFGLVLLLWAWLEVVGPFPGDRWATHFRGWPPKPQPWADIVTFTDLLGRPVIAVATVVVVLWFVARQAGPRAAAFVAVAVVGVAVNAVFKKVLGPTPLWEQHHSPPGANFPSGHVVYAMAVFGAIAWLGWERGRRDVAVAAAVVIVVMGPFRVISGAHYVSDVVAGYLFGAAWLVVAALLTGRAVGRGASARHPDPDPGA